MTENSNGKIISTTYKKRLRTFSVSPLQSAFSVLGDLFWWITSVLSSDVTKEFHIRTAMLRHLWQINIKLQAAEQVCRDVFKMFLTEVYPPKVDQ